MGEDWKALKPKKKFSLLYVHLHYERFPFNAFSLNKFNENLNG